MEFTNELALLLLLLIPLIAGVLIPFFSDRPNFREAITFLAGILLLFDVIYLLSVISSGIKPELHLFTFAGNFDIRLELEPLGAIFAAIASSLWIINSVFTLGYMRGNKEKNQTRFFALVAIAIFGTMGIAASVSLIASFILLLLTCCLPSP